MPWKMFVERTRVAYIRLVRHIIQNVPQSLLLKDKGKWGVMGDWTFQGQSVGVQIKLFTEVGSLTGCEDTSGY